jgi:hypothetical protein
MRRKGKNFGAYRWIGARIKIEVIIMKKYIGCLVSIVLLQSHLMADGVGSSGTCNTTGAVAGINFTCQANDNNVGVALTGGSGDLRKGGTCGHKYNQNTGEFNGIACGGTVVDSSSTE